MMISIIFPQDVPHAEQRAVQGPDLLSIFEPQ
jgi:hypothetical protein